MPANQQEALEAWLFEENLSYQQAKERLYQDFGVRCSSSSLVGFYQRKAQARLLKRITESAGKANQVVEKFRENPADMHSAVLKLVGQIAFETSLKDQFDPEILFNFTKLLIASRNQELKGEALNLQREKFEFDAAKACLKKLPALRQIATDAKLDEEEKIAAVRQVLWGAR